MSYHWHKCEIWWAQQLQCPLDDNLPPEDDDDDEDEDPIPVHRGDRESKDEPPRQKFDAVELEDIIPVFDRMPKEVERKLPTTKPPWIGVPIPPVVPPQREGPTPATGPKKEPVRAGGYGKHKITPAPWPGYDPSEPWDELFATQGGDFEEEGPGRQGQTGTAPAWSLAMQMQNERNKSSSETALRGMGQVGTIPNIGAARLSEQVVAQEVKRNRNSRSYKSYSKNESKWMKAAKASAIAVATGVGVKVIQKAGRGGPRGGSSPTPSGQPGAGYHQKSVLSPANLASALNF